ncbi:MAG: pilus assembly protein [Gilliamella sp.]|uniref:TadE/TadG family type IV pilus assembly protein n=1 Tax=unclassified Gilliamella TaxID=2685620 RepID=UPI000460D8A0|nr:MULTISPECIES: TadE family protein [Gilliamella]KDN09837.1 hypothetical protein GAPWKB30_1560 [Gilliamella apicola]MCO6538308.1 pilus assembly protein [Gilliamella sp.]MCO6540489.1 pilus assembly protein [Gilliamella sp.]OCG55300.1 hypothetical protein A9G38_01660 [Gilliamella apicola]
MLKYWNLLFRQKNASVSIEFAIVFPYLIVLFLFVLEFSRIMVIGSALDLMTTEITRKTAISQHADYNQQLQELINSEVPSWPYITDPQKFKITVKYCKKIEEAINNNCLNVPVSDAPILLFELKYDYNAMFSNLFGRILDSSLGKKTIIYREFYQNN